MPIIPQDLSVVSYHCKRNARSEVPGLNNHSASSDTRFFVVIYGTKLTGFRPYEVSMPSEAPWQKSMKNSPRGTKPFGGGPLLSSVSTSTEMTRNAVPRNSEKKQAEFGM